MKEVTVNELFSGIGTQSLAFKYEGIPHKVVGIAEICPNAIKAYEVLHGETDNYGDISGVERLGYADFWTYSFPCQDLSSGGKGEGLKRGTRSGLLWEVERLLEVAVKEGKGPKYLLLENVPTLLQKKHLPLFEKWLSKLEELGYKNYYSTMNSRDYGVPQNRDRVFVVSIREDIDKEFYFFDIPKEPLPSFEGFLDKETVEYKGPFKIDERISPSVVEAYEAELDKIRYGNTMGIYRCDAESGFQDKIVGINYSPTIRHQNNHTAILYNNQIHKLTAREAWMFMGIRGEDYDLVREKTGLSENILSGLAGNAIVVDVLRGIYRVLFEEGVDYERGD